MNNYNAVLARNTEKAPQAIGISSQTVAYSHYNHISAQLPLDPQTSKLVSGNITKQAIQCFENIKAIVESIDHVMSDVVKITVYVTNIKDVDQVDAVYKTYFPTYVPTQTKLAVDALPFNALVQVEALVSNGEGTIPNAPQSGDLIKLVNNTINAPTSVLSSQSVAFSHYNNLSAQLPIDPKTGRLVVGGVKEQTQQCLSNIKAILDSVNVPLDDVVKVNIAIKNLSDLQVVNEVYSTFFPDSAIARAVGYTPSATIVVAKELMMDALVQIDVVVSHGDGTPPQLIEDRHGIIIEANNTNKAPQSGLSTQSVAFSHYNNLSAQLPIDPTTHNLVSNDIKDQAKQCLMHIKNIVESVDHTMEDVVKVTIFLKDILDIDAVNEVYASFFAKGTPARTVIGVSELLSNAKIQMDAVISNAEGTPPII